MKYRRLKGYKYQIVSEYSYLLPEEFAGYLVNTDFIRIEERILTIRMGYAWDGPSGPTIDTKTFMRGSLIHDALYQLIREKLLSKDLRKSADIILKKECLVDGMSRWRAAYVYWFVRMFGSFACKSKNDLRPIIEI